MLTHPLPSHPRADPISVVQRPHGGARKQPFVYTNERTASASRAGARIDQIGDIAVREPSGADVQIAVVSGPFLHIDFAHGLVNVVQLQWSAPGVWDALIQLTAGLRKHPWSGPVPSTMILLLAINHGVASASLGAGQKANSVTVEMVDF